MRRLRDAATAEVDIAGLAALRVLFGVVMLVGVVRFVALGWIERQYVEPTYFFTYPGFGWVTVPGPAGLYALFGALAVLAALVTVGLWTRVSAGLFTVGFAYVQLMDVTNYLNHYVLVVLLGALLTVLPAGGAGSIDAWLWPARRRATIPAWMQWLLRFQVAVVYLNAALAKVGPDWLLHGQPLNIWLTSRNELPLIGPLLDEHAVAVALSWAGFLYDATIVGWLSWRRSRPLAYAAVLAFHGLTAVFFEIGMFPYIMVTATTVFFAPDWPRRLLARIAPHRARARDPIPAPPRRALRRATVAALALYAGVQVLVPLRHWLYGGNVLWHEQGMRLSWKVMVREKSGSVTFHVRDPATDRRWQVSPHEYLCWRQVREMSGQPDLVLQLAHHIAADFARRGYEGVEVRAEAWVSLNGRAPALMLDPTVNLAAVSPGLGPARWITAGPDGPPPTLGKVARR